MFLDFTVIFSPLMMCRNCLPSWFGFLKYPNGVWSTTCGGFPADGTRVIFGRPGSCVNFPSTRSRASWIVESGRMLMVFRFSAICPFWGVMVFIFRVRIDCGRLSGHGWCVGKVVNPVPSREPTSPVFPPDTSASLLGFPLVEIL